jgi:ABC-type multidrug transport system ATPase subunit
MVFIERQLALRKLASSPTLSLRDVSIVLGEQQVITNVNMDLALGALVQLAGPNGAGKSTLLRAIAGLLPYRGEIQILGHSPRSIAARQAFFYLPDEAILYEDLTLVEHIHFTAMAYQKLGREKAMLCWLERFNLSDHLNEFPTTHSRGMRQKLALSLALGLAPPLLLMDEPYNGLDLVAQHDLGGGLKAHVRRGGSILFSAHQGELVEALGATIMRLNQGRLCNEL